jgi:hypothetical protein
MKHIRNLTLAASLFAGVNGVAIAGGEAPAGWATAVNNLTVTLTQPVPPEMLRSQFADRFLCRSLDGTSAELDSLAAALLHADWVEQLTYKTTPESLAADIAKAVKNAPISDDVKRYLTPVSGQPERTANVTAMKWIAQQLKARGDQPIAVLLAHIPADDRTAAPHGRIAVVLLAGEMVGREQFRFKQVAFGDFTPPK